MTPSRSFAVFSIVFAVVYSIVYVAAVEQNYALFTYYPASFEIKAWVQPANEGPAMYWYGWIMTSGIAATVAGLIACWLPESVTKRLWSGWSWVVPLGAIVVLGYLLRGFFLR